jgi:hypothetical protein
MRLYQAAICLLMAAVSVTGQRQEAQNDLLNVIREGNSPRVEAMLKAGADPDKRDEMGLNRTHACGRIRTGGNHAASGCRGRR